MNTYNNACFLIFLRNFCNVVDYYMVDMDVDLEDSLDICSGDGTKCLRLANIRMLWPETETEKANKRFVAIQRRVIKLLARYLMQIALIEPVIFVWCKNR